MGKSTVKVSLSEGRSPEGLSSQSDDCLRTSLPPQQQDSVPSSKRPGEPKPDGQQPCDHIRPAPVPVYGINLQSLTLIEASGWGREAYGDAGHMESWQSGWGLTERATRWARSVVWSRAFRVPLGEQGHGLALVPFADMLDHDPNAHIAWHAGFTGADDFQMVTFSPISKASCFTLRLLPKY